MSLKIGIETAVHITNLQLKELNQIGYMQYRISLFFQIKNSQEKVVLVTFRYSSCLRTLIADCCSFLIKRVSLQWMFTALILENFKLTT